MKVPPKFNIEQEDSSNYALRLKKNLYGLKQAAYNWFETLSNALTEIGLIQSQNDPSLFMKKGMIILVYVDDCLIFTTSSLLADQLVQSLSTGHENFILTDEGNVETYLGMKVNKEKDKITLTQEALIDRILA